MHLVKRPPDVILQSELSILAEFEARYFAAVKDLADRMAAGCFVEEGPLAIDSQVVASRGDAGAVIVPACISRHFDVHENPEPVSDSLAQKLEQLRPISRLLNQADFDFMRQNGLSLRATWRLRQRRVKLYFDYLRLLTDLIDRELAEWARYLGQPNCDFESLDRARWQMKRTLWLLKADGVLFWMHLPIDSQSPARRLGEISDLMFGFGDAAAI